MRNLIIYFFPFAMDIVVSLLLFVGRHSLASAGASELIVGTIPLFFGLGYFLSGPIMRAIISQRLAKVEMLGATGTLALLSLMLANSTTITVIQILFCIVPFSVSLFFNAFQAFMLGISTDTAKPLAVTVSLYTFAWSMGFGLGPFISGLAGNYLEWSELYYVATAICILIGIIVILFRPSKRTSTEPKNSYSEPLSRPSLHVVGWLGVLIGLIGWLVIATYWPVIAARQEVSSQLKGLVEFAYAGTYSLTALAVLGLRNWQHQPWYLPTFGSVGVLSLLLFGASGGAFGYLLAACMMGLYTGTTFLFSAYHCMLDVELASKRVAVNEMMVGLAYILGPVMATLLHSEGISFFSAFTRAALFLAALVLIQTLLGFRMNRRGAEHFK